MIAFKTIMLRTAQDSRISFKKIRQCIAESNIIMMRL